jgi:hypothetical protein
LPSWNDSPSENESRSWNEIVRLHGPSAYRTAWRILGQADNAEPRDIPAYFHLDFDAEMPDSLFAAPKIP